MDQHYDWALLADLMRHPDCAEAMREAAEASGRHMSAADWLRFGTLAVRLGASLGHSIGTGLDFRSKTREEFSRGVSPVICGLEVTWRLLASGVAVTSLEIDKNNELRILGQVPSCLRHHGGNIVITVAPTPRGSTVGMTIVFPGQLFAWGAGWELAANIRQSMDPAERRLLDCSCVKEVLVSNSLLTPDEITERMDYLRGQSFPEEDSARLPSELAAFCSGATAEEALTVLVAHLSEPKVYEVLDATLVREGQAGGYPACGPSELARQLGTFGVGVVQSAEWSVTLSDGTGVGPLIISTDQENGDIRFGRLALGALSLVRMRRERTPPPAY